MIKMFKKLKKKDWLLVFLSLIFIVCQVWLDLRLPDYMSNITELVQTEGSKMNDILREGLFMLLCAFGSLISAVVVGYCASRIGTSFGKTLRKNIFDKVMDFNMEEIKRFSTSSLITRNINDVGQV